MRRWRWRLTTHSPAAVWWFFVSIFSLEPTVTRTTPIDHTGSFDCETCAHTRRVHRRIVGKSKWVSFMFLQSVAYFDCVFLVRPLVMLSGTKISHSCSQFKSKNSKLCVCSVKSFESMLPLNIEWTLSLLLLLCVSGAGWARFAVIANRCAARICATCLVIFVRVCPPSANDPNKLT